MHIYIYIYCSATLDLIYSFNNSCLPYIYIFSEFSIQSYLWSEWSIYGVYLDLGEGVERGENHIVEN